MANLNPKHFVPQFFDDTSKTYDKVVSWATFGKDKHWKNEIIKKINFANSILELACGTGILTRLLAIKFPKSEITGIDITKSYLRIAEKNSSSFSNIAYIQQDAEKLALGKKFDIICSSYIPKYCNPKVIVKNCISHLNQNGVIVLHDFTYPKNTLIQILWKSFFVVLNLIGCFASSWKIAFRELPKIIKHSSWLKDYRTELEENGFIVEEQNLTWHTSAILIAKRQKGLP